MVKFGMVALLGLGLALGCENKKSDTEESAKTEEAPAAKQAEDTSGAAKAEKPEDKPAAYEAKEEGEDNAEGEQAEAEKDEPAAAPEGEEEEAEESE
jgi:hypothetical protein